MSLDPRHGHQRPPVETPSHSDVLAGRGNACNYHPGNEYFRALVRKHKKAYVACSKPQKARFSRLIVDEIYSRNGRFLKQDSTTKLWHDIGDKKALDKTRQALREGAPVLVKEIETCDSNSDEAVAVRRVHLRQFTYAFFIDFIRRCIRNIVILPGITYVNFPIRSLQIFVRPRLYF